MITIKGKDEIEVMNNAGQELADLFMSLGTSISAGKSTLEIDRQIENELKRRRFVSQSKGYMGYKHVSCISINDEVVHGVPSDKFVFSEGDLVKVDICAKRDGYCVDMARMFFLGEPCEEIKRFMDVARSALDAGIKKATVGNYLSDISAVIQQEVERNGYGVVRDFAGHGIGRGMHEDPEILNYGKPGKGMVLRPGMTFALEPMITMGRYDVYIADDGWTVRTIDKSLAAHVEDTVAVTEDGPCVLTRIEKSDEGVRD